VGVSYERGNPVGFRGLSSGVRVQSVRTCEVLSDLMFDSCHIANERGACPRRRKSRSGFGV